MTISEDSENKQIDLTERAPEPAMVPGTPSDPKTYRPNENSKIVDGIIHKLANTPPPKPVTIEEDN